MRLRKPEVPGRDSLMTVYNEGRLRNLHGAKKDCRLGS